MSFTTLPDDLYDKIVSHLVGVQLRGKKRPIALGKVLSLVCRRLRPIGQALVWGEINLDHAKFAETPVKVLANYEAYPHLHPLVVKLFSANESIPSAVESEKVIHVVLKIIRHSTNLDYFCINLPDHTPPSLVRQLFDTAACLESLRFLGLQNAAITLDPAAIETLYLSFPDLEYLAICLVIPADALTNFSVSRPKGSRAGVLEGLSLGVYDIDPDSEQITKLFLMLASALGTFGLLECRLSESLLHRSTLFWLTLDNFHVRNLSFTFSPTQSDERLLCLLHWLPKLDRLVALSINPNIDHDEHRNISVKSPFSLVQLLDAVPFSIHFLLLKGIHFFGSLSYATTRLKPSALALIEGPSVQFYLKTSTSHTFVTLV